MKIATWQHGPGEYSGVVVGDRAYALPDGTKALDLVRLGLPAALHIGEQLIATNSSVPLAEVRLLPPIQPPAMPCPVPCSIAMANCRGCWRP